MTLATVSVVMAAVVVVTLQGLLPVSAEAAVTQVERFQTATTTIRKLTARQEGQGWQKEEEGRTAG
jgi:hypothetical protein